jgi:hypothetical protein
MHYRRINSENGRFANDRERGRKSWRSRCELLLILFVSAILVLSLSGCMAIGARRLDPPSAFATASSGKKYCIRKSVIKWDEKTKPKVEKSLRMVETGLSAEELMKRAIIEYPGVFSNESGAVPIRIEIETKVKTKWYSVAGFVLVIGTLGTVPGPVWGEGTITVGWSEEPYGTATDREGKGFCRVESMGWITIYDPLGMIPVPFHSDERVSVPFFMFMVDKVNRFSIQFDQKSVLQALVKSL